MHTTLSNISYQLAKKYEYLSTTAKSVKCFYVNARSIMSPGKLDELQCIIHSFSVIIHIIVISETWIKSDFDARQSQLPGYTHYYNHRTDGRGGGISIFAHKSIKHDIIEDKTVNGNHYFWIHLEKFSVDIGAVYKPGSSNTKYFIDMYSEQLQRRKRAVTIGDFNYDLLKPNPSVREY